MIRVFERFEALSRAAAQIFVEAARQACAARGRFSVALAGGSTPRRLYELLADRPFCEQVDWQRVHVFWGDERCVPADDVRSNARMAHETLLGRVPIPAENIHTVQGLLKPVWAAVEYEAQLKAFFDQSPPVFDLILLGLGSNAHTASLFPHTLALDEAERWVSEVYVPDLDTFRVTLTAPLINRARQVVFMVTGADKATALHNVLEGAYHPHAYPAQLIQPQTAHPLWLVDKAAAHKLTVDFEGEGDA